VSIRNFQVSGRIPVEKTRGERPVLDLQKTIKQRAKPWQRRNRKSHFE